MASTMSIFKQGGAEPNQFLRHLHPKRVDFGKTVVLRMTPRYVSGLQSTREFGLTGSDVSRQPPQVVRADCVDTLRATGFGATS